MFLGPSGDRTFFMITHTSKRARDISRISLVPGEDEVILPPNSRFDVVSVLVSTDGRVDVYLKEIIPLDPIMMLLKLLTRPLQGSTSSRWKGMAKGRGNYRRLLNKPLLERDS